MEPGNFQDEREVFMIRTDSISQKTERGRGGLMNDPLKLKKGIAKSIITNLQVLQGIISIIFALPALTRSTTKFSFSFRVT
ncbi:ABC transporter permease [Sesbania bispinosa]|nr:ABC transporter permease [Sesbania bispinosa]